MTILYTTQYKDCLGTFIADLFCKFSLGWLKRDGRIRKHQREGIDAAHLNGVSFRRPKAERNEEFIEICNY